MHWPSEKPKHFLAHWKMKFLLLKRIESQLEQQQTNRQQACQQCQKIPPREDCKGSGGKISKTFYFTSFQTLLQPINYKIRERFNLQKHTTTSKKWPEQSLAYQTKLWIF